VKDITKTKLRRIPFKSATATTSNSSEVNMENTINTCEKSASHISKPHKRYN